MIGAAVRDGTLPGRVWMYSTYACNLACAYCLTESAPASPPRALTADTMRSIAKQAKALGFTALGITGGEPFVAAWMPELVAELGSLLPTVVLSNGTLFRGQRLERMRALAGTQVAIQISLDRATPDVHDALRGDGNHAAVLAGIRALVDLGVRVRVASTVSGFPDVERDALTARVRELGIAPEDHIVRPIVRRGRAAMEGLGVVATTADLQPELTIAAHGAFWSPFGPTIRGGRPDTDLLICRTILPLEVPAKHLLGLVRGMPRGEDARLGIR